MMNQHIKALDNAERHFQAGRMREGADLVWNATYTAVKDAARRHNLPCASETDVFTSAPTLDVICPHPFVIHALHLSAADLYRHQTSGDDIPDEIRWEPHEFVENLAGLRLMIQNLEAYRHPAAATT